MEPRFLGNEQMTVDDKGRVGLPARFVAVLRALAPEEPDALGMMLTPDRSIKLMPAPMFEQEVERWTQWNDQVDDERLLLNLSTSLAERVTLDKQNRFRLNPLMMKVCRIKRDVVIVGSLRYMQLFDLEVWNEMLEQGLPRMGKASTAAARRGEPPAPVQYIIQTPPLSGPTPGA